MASTAVSVIYPPWLEEVCIRLRSNDASLTNLNLNIRRLTPVSLAYLCDALKDNNQLLTLNLTNSLVPPIEIRTFIDGFSHHTSLQTLHLSYNKIVDVSALGTILRVNKSLQNVFLNYNLIHDDIKVFSEALKTNNSLRVLHLGKNAIRDRGAIALAEMLQENKSLQLLSLVWNQIGRQGISALLEGLEWNTSLRVLEIDQNPGADQDAIRRAQQLGLTNSYGRHLLHCDERTIPDGLWAHLLAKKSQDGGPNRVYFFLKSKPDLCSRSPLLVT